VTGVGGPSRNGIAPPPTTLCALMSPERERRAEVSLGRLRTVARPAPAPAVAVGRAVLGALAALHLRGLVHGAVTAGDVLVAGDGSVRLEGEGGRPALTPARLAELQQEEVEAAWALVAGLVEASPVTPPAALRTLLAGPVPRTGAHTALAALVEAAGELSSESGQRRAAARLAELVAPLIRHRHGPAQPTAGAVGAATVITAGGPAGPRPAARRRRLPLLLGAVAVAAAAALSTGLLVSRGSTGPRPRTAPPAAVAATPLPTAPPPAPIPDPPVEAPPSAGGIAAVRLAPATAPCLPAAGCALQVGVDLLPHSAVTTLRVVLRLVDRCTGTVSEVALPPLRVAPGAASAEAVITVRVPAGPAPAIIALTTSPARAASPPLLVAPYLPTC
jgi:hypothetical protein